MPGISDLLIGTLLSLFARYVSDVILIHKIMSFHRDKHIIHYMRDCSWLTVGI